MVGRSRNRRGSLVIAGGGGGGGGRGGGGGGGGDGGGAGGHVESNNLELMQLVSQTSRRLNELEDLLRQDSNDNSDDSDEEKNAHTVGHGADEALLSERTDALEERIGWLLRQADLVDGLQKSLELHHEVRLKRNQ